MLKDHKIVAWDFDGTLIDHHKADLFHEFIRRNPYGQKHYIVTFRSHGWELEVWNDLTRHVAPPARDCFVEVVNIPNEKFTAFNNYPSLPPQEQLVAIDQFNTWKGFACQEIGATILIDDMTANVITGCLRHGVAHVHPNDLV